MDCKKGDLKDTEKVLLQKAKILENRKNRKVFFNANLLAFYGWYMAIPVLLFTATGAGLNKIFPTVNFMFPCILLGFVLGIINASLWLKKQLIVNKKKDSK